MPFKDLVDGESLPDQLFPESGRTRWQTLPTQTFELDVELDASFKLQLELESWGYPPRTRIKREAILCDRRPVFEFVEGEVHLFNDRFEHKVTYPFNWFQSALATIQPRPENSKLMRFKNWMMESLYCLQVKPHAVAKQTEKEEASLAPDMSNFASWYRHMSQERAGSAAKLQDQLRSVIPGLESLNLRSAGANLRTVEARFEVSGAESRRGFTVAFDELSDGQRVLICLYALLNFVVEDGACLFLDEPENYLAIPETQPWLVELTERIEECGAQAVWISHHPELIDYLAPEKGLVLERNGPGPVRVHRFVSGTPLSPSEQLARRWPVHG